MCNYKISPNQRETLTDVEEEEESEGKVLAGVERSRKKKRKWSRSEKWIEKEKEKGRERERETDAVNDGEKEENNLNASEIWDLSKETNTGFMPNWKEEKAERQLTSQSVDKMILQ